MGVKEGCHFLLPLYLDFVTKEVHGQGGIGDCIKRLGFEGKEKLRIAGFIAPHDFLTRVLDYIIR